MRAVRFTEYGGPEVLHVEDIDEPHPGAGQIRIAVRAAAVNPLDWKIRNGVFKDMSPDTLPLGVGFDAAGIVDEVGEGVTDVLIGDEVFGSGRFVFAEFAVLDHWALKPAGVSFEEAAGYSMAAETASRVLDEVGVVSGQTLLISGASGGVGTAAIQFAVSRGITVLATASAKNLDYLRGLGAVALPYGEGLAERVRALAPQGVDAALDLAGSGVIDELIAVTENAQKVLSTADFTAASKGAKATVVPDHHDEAYRELTTLVPQGKFTIPVAQTFALEDTGEAQALSEIGHVRGKFIVAISL